MQTATQPHRGAADALLLWLSHLGARPFDTRLKASAMLCGHGTLTRQVLVQGIGDVDARLRAGSVTLLSSIGEPEYLETVTACLNDTSVMVRRAAVHGLSTLAADPAANQPAITDAYVRVARDDASPVVRNTALHALGTRPYSGTAHRLLTDYAKTLTSPKLRRSASWSLQQQTRKQAEPAPFPSVTAAAVPDVPLVHLDTETLVSLLGHDLPRVRAEANGVLFARSRDVLAELAAGFRHADVRVRRACVNLMDHLADDSCFGPLTDALHDLDAGVRRGALHSLTCQMCKPSPLSGDRIAPLIERALRDTDARVRQVATGALAPFADDARVRTALQTLARSAKDTVTRKRAVAALATQSPPVR